ncbi:RNA-binding domain-containing protein [Actinoplanes sp. M2I2]|uniref:RNA-binding domain-containing protein n=1 Tax=Actinoplanes sp. M2I2 TaxID=1734444 RepID=UPI002021CF86|nr:RNA-binding domain-containing protein [Actinoplanes sp. M2I2]
MRELLRLPAETEWLEDKVSNGDAAEIGSYISTLANGAALAGRHRGYLLWGVEDGTRVPVGTEFDPLRQKVGNENLENWLLRHLKPQIHFTFHRVSVSEKPLVVLEIDRALQQPVTFKGEAFIRVGSYKKKLGAHPDVERRLWKSFVLGAFEDGIAADLLSPSDVLQLLDYPSYFRVMKAPLPESRSGILDALNREGMARLDDSDTWAVTNLGAILFAHDLDEFSALRRKSVRVIQYRGSSRVETVKEQEGVHGYAGGFAGLVGYINELIPSSEVIGQALRRTAGLYPELAVRELVANALLHQDFLVAGSGPTVEVFDDRMEITNPGRPLVDPLRFIDSPPMSRNERMGRIMRRGPCICTPACATSVPRRLRTPPYVTDSVSRRETVPKHRG